MFWYKKVKTQQQQNKKSNIKTLAWAGNWIRDLLHPKQMRNLCTPSQLRVTIVVKLFYCFDAMGRNVNKQPFGSIAGNTVVPYRSLKKFFIYH